MITLFGLKFGHLDAKAIAEDQMRKAKVLHLECTAHAEDLRARAQYQAGLADLYLNRTQRLQDYLDDADSFPSWRRAAPVDQPF